MPDQLGSVRDVQRMATHHLQAGSTLAKDSTAFARDVSRVYQTVEFLHAFPCNVSEDGHRKKSLVSMSSPIARRYQIKCYGLGTSLIDFLGQFAANNLRGLASQPTENAGCAWFAADRRTNPCQGLFGCHLPPLTRTLLKTPSAEAARGQAHLSGRQRDAASACRAQASLNWQHPVAADWLAGAVHTRGFCSPTSYGGACYGGARGAWNFDSLDTCIAACRACANCRFVSFSKAAADCSWYRACSRPTADQKYITISADAFPRPADPICAPTRRGGPFPASGPAGGFTLASSPACGALPVNASPASPTASMASPAPAAAATARAAHGEGAARTSRVPGATLRERGAPGATKASRDGWGAASSLWFDARWGTMLHFAASAGYVFGLPPPPQPPRDATPSSCIAVHVRRGDACHNADRQCYSHAAYLRAAMEIRRRCAATRLRRATAAQPPRDRHAAAGEVAPPPSRGAALT